MKIANYFSATLATLYAAQAASKATKYPFRPEKDDVYWDPVIPILYDLGESQSTDIGGSYWTSSFLTGTNDKQYLVISHVLSFPGYAYLRASTLELETLKHVQFISTSDGALINDGETYNLDINGNGFEALSADNVSTQHTYSNHQDLSFDITWNATSRALANAGAGAFTFGPVSTYQWGVPAGRTEGSITIKGGNKISIDPERSFTWYDRQWSISDEVSSPGNWTWFELHIPDSTYKLSIWNVDTVPLNQYTRFATIRGQDGQHQVLPVEWIPHYKRSYKSKAADITYALDWTVRVSGFGEFEISSVVEDQELVGSSALETAYTGFVTYTGKVAGKKIKGYGVVELVYGSWE